MTPIGVRRTGLALAGHVELFAAGELCVDGLVWALAGSRGPVCGGYFGILVFWYTKIPKYQNTKAQVRNNWLHTRGGPCLYFFEGGLVPGGTQFPLTGPLVFWYFGISESILRPFSANAPGAGAARQAGAAGGRPKAGGRGEACGDAAGAAGPRRRSRGSSGRSDQNTKIPKYQNTKIPKYQNTKIPKYQNTKGHVSQNWLSTRGVLASIFFSRGGLSRVEPQF